jgi:DNA-binding response OmpR family regulator
MVRTNTILMIDRNARNLELLGDFLQNQGYATLSATSLEAIETIMSETKDIGLSLVDISGFDRSIWDYCQMMSERNIPFIVISPKQVASIREEGRSHGAKDVLLKPLVAQELVGLIRNLMIDEEK